MKIRFTNKIKNDEVIENTTFDADAEEIRSIDIFGTAGLSIENFIDVGKLFEYYDTNDMTEMLAKLNVILLPNLTKDFDLLTAYQKIDGIPDITNTSVSDITKKYFEVRTAINTVLEIRRRYLAYKENWDELITFVKNMYDRKKDSTMLDKRLGEYSNQKLREAKVNEMLLPLVKQKDRMTIAMMRIKQFTDEVNFTIDYLEGVNAEVSRIQSAIVLALDSGEISRCQWRSN